MIKNKEIEEILSIISSIDALSCGRGSSLEYVDELAWKYGFEEWKNAKKDLERMIKVPLLLNRNMRLYTYAFAISNPAHLFFLFFLFIFGTASFFGLYNPSQRFIGFFYFIATVTFLLIIVRWFSKSRIDAFFERNRASQKQRDDNIHSFIQSVINSAKKKMEETGEDKGKHKIRLFMTDYENIKIVSEPGLLRDYFVAIIS